MKKNEVTPKEMVNVFLKENGVYEVIFYNGVRLGDFIPGDDGLYHFWPDCSRGGYWTAPVMREIVDLLNNLNNVR
jgi:hypothetical protein